MFYFYIDESGNPDRYHSPLQAGETPLFTLTALCIHETVWRNVTHDLNYLKQRFYKKEIGAKVPHYFEVKGNELTRPGGRNNRRNHAYLDSVLRLCDKYLFPFFSVIIRKSYLAPADKTSIYTMSLQYLVERFQYFLEENDDNGLMVVDSRVHNIDFQVAKSHLSFVFGNITGRQCNRIIEAPMFTDSRLTAGLQLVDIVSSCIYTDNYYWKCRTFLGAHNYYHMTKYRPYLKNREFHSRLPHGGYKKHGYRYITHRP